MPKILLEDLQSLVNQNVISEETATRIRSHYAAKQLGSSNRMLVVFGILGALLTGLGIILIVAHNWYSFNKAVKLIFAFFPLLIGQAGCVYCLLKNDKPGIKEAASTFLFFSIAASISIVSQVYQVNGSIIDFLFLWMLLSLPVVYTMNSSMTSLLYLIGITWYAAETNYFVSFQHKEFAYWPFLLAILPHYHSLAAKPGLFFHFHSWFVAISLAIALGTLSDQGGELLLMAYLSMASAMLLLGQARPYADQRLASNAFLIIGSFGIISILLGLSFDGFWKWLPKSNIEFSFYSTEFVAATISTLLATYLLYKSVRRHSWKAINPKSYAYILFGILFGIGFSLPRVSQVVVNISILMLAVFTIADGSKKDSLSRLNYGLLILTALISCRFFDTELSFVIRGMIFVVVGLGFFFFNYYIVKRRRAMQ